MTRNLEIIPALITAYGFKVIGAIIILIVGRLAAKLGKKFTFQLMRKWHMDPGLTSFAGGIVHALILVFAVVAALSQFGVETASLVVVLGSVGFAIGFALQGSLSNFAAGVLILIFRPFKVDDYIDAAGVAGTVKEIDLFTTTLATPDNVKIIVPNGKLSGDILKNYSAHETRRVDFVFGIGYGSSIGRAKEVLMELIRSDQRVLAAPEPFIAVTELADSSVNLVVRVWVNRADYWGVKFDLTEKTKEAFDQNGIEIPFPQNVVHVHNQNQ